MLRAAQKGSISKTTQLSAVFHNQWKSQTRFPALQYCDIFAQEAHIYLFKILYYLLSYFFNSTIQVRQNIFKTKHI